MGDEEGCLKWLIVHPILDSHYWWWYKARWWEREKRRREKRREENICVGGAQVSIKNSLHDVTRGYNCDVKARRVVVGLFLLIQYCACVVFYTAPYKSKPTDPLVLIFLVQVFFSLCLFLFDGLQISINLLYLLWPMTL